MSDQPYFSSTPGHLGLFRYYAHRFILHLPLESFFSKSQYDDQLKQYCVSISKDNFFMFFMLGSRPEPQGRHSPVIINPFGQTGPSSPLSHFSSPGKHIREVLRKMQNPISSMQENASYRAFNGTASFSCGSGIISAAKFEYQNSPIKIFQLYHDNTKDHDPENIDDDILSLYEIRSSRDKIADYLIADRVDSWRSFDGVTYQNIWETRIPYPGMLSKKRDESI